VAARVRQLPLGLLDGIVLLRHGGDQLQLAVGRGLL
jgi:hypothetical protein